MVLVDSSVLINYLNNKDDDQTRIVDFFIDNHVPFGINSFIYEEILQGAVDEWNFKKMKDILDSFIFYDLKKEKQSYVDAAKIMFKCRKAGISIRSTVDCLIAQSAIENNVMLLHNDSDFTNMAKIIPELQIFEL